VAELLQKAREKLIRPLLAWVNLGEVYYRLYRHNGEIEAKKVLETIKKWPLEILVGDEDLTLAAAKVKALHPLSYADALAIGAALQYKATVVTGDPEIKEASSEPPPGQARRLLKSSQVSRTVLGTSSEDACLKAGLTPSQCATSKHPG